MEHERIVNGAKKYLSLRGYEYLGDSKDFLVYYDPDEDCRVFVRVLSTMYQGEDEGSASLFTSSNAVELRDSFEEAMSFWFIEHADEPEDIVIRCDEICLCVLSGSRAMVRHFVNACNIF